MTAPSKRLPLPDSWVERIFDRMQGLYGSLWLDRWRSGEIVEQNGKRFDRGLLLAKAAWGEELGGFAGQSDRIARALESCRHRSLPPTLPEFLDLCRQGVTGGPRTLPAPRMSADDVAPRIAALASKVAKPKKWDTQWANGEPPAVRGPWESAIIELAEKGDQRFVAILQEHVDNRVITSERARAALNGGAANADAA